MRRNNTYLIWVYYYWEKPVQCNRAEPKQFSWSSTAARYSEEPDINHKVQVVLGKFTVIKFVCSLFVKKKSMIIWFHMVHSGFTVGPTEWERCFIKDSFCCIIKLLCTMHCNLSGSVGWILTPSEHWSLMLLCNTINKRYTEYWGYGHFPSEEKGDKLFQWNVHIKCDSNTFPIRADILMAAKGKCLLLSCAGNNV